MNELTVCDFAVIAADASYAARNRKYRRRNLWLCVFGFFAALISLILLVPFLPL